MNLGSSAEALPKLPAGFAVVKKGKDKKTGEPVAIKVRRLHVGSTALDASTGHLGRETCNLGSPPMQVVDKSRYAAGDNSLEREIQVLIKVRRAGRLWPELPTCWH